MRQKPLPKGPRISRRCGSSSKSSCSNSSSSRRKSSKSNIISGGTSSRKRRRGPHRRPRGRKCKQRWVHRLDLVSNFDRNNSRLVVVGSPLLNTTRDSMPATAPPTPSSRSLRHTMPQIKFGRPFLLSAQQLPLLSPPRLPLRLRRHPPLQHPLRWAPRRVSKSQRARGKRETRQGRQRPRRVTNWSGPWSVPIWRRRGRNWRRGGRSWRRRRRSVMKRRSWRKRRRKKRRRTSVFIMSEKSNSAATKARIAAEGEQQEQNQDQDQKQQKREQQKQGKKERRKQKQKRKRHRLEVKEVKEEKLKKQTARRAPALMGAPVGPRYQSRLRNPQVSARHTQFGQFGNSSSGPSGEWRQQLHAPYNPSNPTITVPSPYDAPPPLPPQNPLASPPPRPRPMAAGTTAAPDTLSPQFTTSTLSLTAPTRYQHEDTKVKADDEKGQEESCGEEGCGN